MRKTIIYLTVVVVIILGAGCSATADNKQLRIDSIYGGLDVKEIASLNSLIKQSGSILEVVKTGNVEEVVDQHVELTLTEVNVKRVLYGDVGLKDQTIRILDLKSISMGVYDKEDRYILFLNPKTGRLGNDLYSITGVYQGKFKVVKDQLVYDADSHGGVKKFQNELSGLSIDEGVNRIQSKLRGLKISDTLD